MGFIYKVTCKVNDKKYIGLTNISINHRWSGHIGSSYNPNDPDYDFAFHRAIRKYGVSNFVVEEIDQGVGEELKEKEKYWIKFFDSYNNGYNETLGGDGQCKYDYEEIVDFYLKNNNSLLETCQHFKIYDQVVYSALKSQNIDYKNLPKGGKRRKSHKKKILLVEENIVFNSMAEIDNYFGKVAHPNIRRCLNGMTKKAYGYTWKEIEE